MATTGARFAEEILARAGAQPEAVAARDAEGVLTYGELRARARALAEGLAERGVGPGDVVAVGLDRGRAAIVAWLGILEAEAAYMPVDLSYPASRVAAMLGAVAPAAVVTSRTGDAALEHTGARHVLEADGTSAGATGARPGATTRVGEDIAYIIFTSGSTGVPKGVAVSAGQLGNLVRWQRNRPLGDEPVRTAQFSALSFDVSAQEVFSTLAAGGSLEVVSTEARRDPERLLEELTERKVARLFLPFAALQALATVAGDAPRLPPLRYVATAGEQLSVTPALRALFARLPGCRLENHYGPTETHLVTAFALGDEPGDWPERPPIGRPVEGLVAGILDGALRPVPAGERGTLHVSSPALTGGYVGRADLTAERYLPNVLSGGGERMYNTGDVVWEDADGDLHFAGRDDDQVKIRGFRVEPAEVESVLLSLPSVTAAAAVVEPGAVSKTLVGHVRLAENASSEWEDELRSGLAARLPEWSIPARLVRWDGPMPQLANGKVDRLRLATHGEAEPAAALREPDGADLVGQLAALWSDVLGVPIGADDDFFEVGGHSLAAVELVGRIRADLGIRVKVRQIFEHPTVADLARRLEEAAAP